MQKNKISIYAAASIVVANMIGTGVFTSLGFQLSSVQNTWSIVLLWVLGGLLSLFGAFAYAELGTTFKENGGDYIYLSRVFHPVMGYLSAWTGLTVGFSAPVALAAIAFVKYLSVLGISGLGMPLAVTIILGIGVMHSFSLSMSSKFQVWTTALKLLFLIALIAVGFYFGTSVASSLDWSAGWTKEIIQPNFAVSMVYVSYAYVGWNAASYVAGEIENPRQNLPKSLILSTLFVALCYVLFQIVMLKSSSVASLAGKEEVASVAFTNLMGSTFGKWVSVFIALQLIATISSYLWVGPRVTHAMASEFRLWKPLSKTNKNGIPVLALWVHVLISIVLAISGSFEKVLVYAGFVLQLMGSLTVATSLFIKIKSADTFKSPFKPILQILFLLFNAGVLVFTAFQRPTESFAGLGLLFIGLIIYLFDKKIEP